MEETTLKKYCLFGDPNCPIKSLLCCKFCKEKDHCNAVCKGVTVPEKVCPFQVTKKALFFYKLIHGRYKRWESYEEAKKWKEEYLRY